MIEFDGNPFESFPSNVSLPEGNKFPVWAWIIIVSVILFIGYQTYMAFFAEKEENDKE
jgi:hypothetical protein